MVKKFIRRSYNKNEAENTANKSDAMKLKSAKVDPKLKLTLETIKTIYTYPDNQDVVLRDLYISGLNKDATILFISTITNTRVIDEYIITPLLLNSNPNKQITDIVTIQSVQRKNLINDIVLQVNNGYAALFIEGEGQAYLLDVANFEGRSIEKPENEKVVKGPNEAFTEKASTNISLIRKKIKSSNLMVESLTVSKRSNNNLNIVYVKDLANEKLVQNVKDRLNSLNVDSIQNLSLLEQQIEERKYSLFPTILYTERPDRATSFLEDGYIVLLMDNSPDSLVLPATFWSFYHTSEDHYLRYPYGNFTRLLRILALFITLFTSALYVAIVTYHSEMVPPDLLLAIAATREKVPFPAAIEIILMEIAFELIREAGLRVPSPIGPTIGIVGALILGQAAVQANIVSPIVIIIVALSGLSSFAIGDISMNFTIRIARLLLIFSASFMGLYGITALFTMGLYYLVSIKSFGVPYLSPLTPHYKSSNDRIFRKVLQKEIFRPGYLKPKDISKR